MRIKPPLSIEELAQRLEIDTNQLLAFSAKAPSLYRVIQKTRGEGKPPRILNPPHRALKEIQRKLLDTTLVHLHCDIAFFARKGTNIVDAVNPHIAKPILITMDIQNFFPTVTSCQVYTALRSRGIPSPVAKIIKRLTTHKNHLPQGAPTSSALGILVLHPVISEVKHVLNSTRAQYAISVYVDDIIISGPIGLKRMINTIIKIFKRHGFTIDRDKKLNIMKSTEGEQEALGICVSKGIKPGKKILSKLSSLTPNSAPKKVY